MNIRKTLADNMRRYRKSANLTQEGLAERSGLHRTYIGGIEQERINVSLNNISKIAKALGVNPALLLMGSYDAQASSTKSTTKQNESDSSQVHYALCTFEDDGVFAQPINVQNVDLDIRILCALIQDGIKDPDELAERFASTQQQLLTFFEKHRLQ